MTLSEYIDAIFLDDLRRMVHEAKLTYLAFGVIASGIEFVGACYDEHDFDADGRSKERFNRGIQKMSKCDKRYNEYNKGSSEFNLYRYLRGGMAHIVRPAGLVQLSERKHGWARVGPCHLEVIDGQLLLICEDFYDHFKRCCEDLKRDLPTLAHPKLRAEYLCVGPLITE